MSYFTGSVCAVKNNDKQRYVEHAKRSWPMLKKHGALRMMETWGENVPHGKQTDFWRAVAAKDDESVVFSWIEWPDKATADRSWEEMQKDPAMASMQMPFDGKRMIWGGFAPLLSQGSGKGAGYYSGFVVPVPSKNREAYSKAANMGWDMFKKLGATWDVEAWGEDVPHGKTTDFYRATEAKPDETIVFSWIGWPDKATADKADEKMMNDPSMQNMEMPFDGRRMIWGGFAPLVDERA